MGNLASSAPPPGAGAPTGQAGSGWYGNRVSLAVSGVPVLSADLARKRFSAVELRLFENGFDRLCKSSPASGWSAVDWTTFRSVLLADFPDLPEALSRRLFTVSTYD